MSRHGMTILELLLALALLGGLTIACVAWTTTATRSLTEQGGSAAWRRGAEASLDYLGDLIAASDARDTRSRDPWRVRTESARLTVHTRQVVAREPDTPVPAESVELALSGTSLVAIYRDSDGRELARRPLLGQVTGLEIAVTEISKTQSQLAVTLRGELGGRAERSWAFAAREVQ